MNIAVILIFLAESFVSYEITGTQSLIEIEGVSNVIESKRRLENSEVSAVRKRPATSAGNNPDAVASSVGKNLDDFITTRRDENAKIEEEKIEAEKNEASDEIAHKETATNANRGSRRPSKRMRHNYCSEAENYVRETLRGNFVRERNYHSDGPIKRDAKHRNATAIRKRMYESDDGATDAKTAVRKQFKVDGSANVIRQEGTVPVIPITTEIFGIGTRDLNVNIDLELTEKPGNVKGAWDGRRHESDIRFSELPQKEAYLIPTLKLEAGFYPFRFVTEFFKHIYPSDFPVGKSIKVESIFLASVTIFVCVALIIPAYLLCLAVMALLAKTDSGEDAEAGALFPEERRPDCKGRFNVAVMSVVILFCCGCIAGMTVSNEQASEAVHASRTAARCACSDLANWITAAARDIHESLLPPIDLVTEAYKEDLKSKRCSQ
ncbi:hypothetical protein EVAR_38475_1 [Eumeta japonica]|uniref:Uncharacterized protein n=1 Tax=Eumeta variegata TaxID=151549 RepID=A0A4C1WPS2_EUMVA|nr:hypothetical protein EVAR_38475_1 [Eumeta japonica]